MHSSTLSQRPLTIRSLGFATLLTLALAAPAPAQWGMGTPESAAPSFAGLSLLGFSAGDAGTHGTGGVPHEAAGNKAAKIKGLRSREQASRRTRARIKTAKVEAGEARTRAKVKTAKVEAGEARTRVKVKAAKAGLVEARSSRTRAKAKAAKRRRRIESGSGRNALGSVHVRSIGG